MTLRSPLPLLGGLLIALTLAVPAPALDLGGHVREGVVVGLGLGGGWSSYEFALGDQRVETDAEGALSGGLSLGWARDDRWLLSVTFAGWRKDFSQDLTPIELRNFHLLGAVTWFPGGQGGWLKAGAGLGNVDLTARTPEQLLQEQGNGWSFLAGAGWEYRVNDLFALGLAYELRTLDVGDFGPFGETTGLTHQVSLALRYYQL